MNIIDCIQGSDAWRKARAAKVTSSCIAAVMAKGKGGAESTVRRNYLAKIAVETMTCEPMMEDYYNSNMARGNELESAARECYEFFSGVSVEQVGFVLHPSIENYGASPDGLVGDEGMIQIKCPIPAIHINYLLDNIVPTDYHKQMQSEMACTGRKWNDFVSYCPAMPVELQLFVKRLDRDDALILQMENAVKDFNREVAAMVAKLEAMRI